MPQYDFQSPGGNVADTIQKILLAREVAKRQAMLDDLNKRNVESQIQDRVGDRELRKVQMDNTTANTKAVNADRDLRTSAVIAETLPRGKEISQDTSDALGPLAAGTTDVAGGVLPEGEGPTKKITFTGTEKGRQFDESQGLKQQISELTNDWHNRTAEIAQMAAEGRINAAKAAAEMAQTKAEMTLKLNEMTLRIGQDKLDTTRQTAADKKSSVQATRDDVRTVAESVLNDPHLDEVFGAIQGRLPSVRSTSVDLDARVTRLKGLLSLENASKMKNQGAISESERALLASSVTSLDQRVGDTKTIRKELQRIIDATHGNAPGSGDDVIAPQSSHTPVSTPATATGVPATITPSPAKLSVDELIAKYGGGK